MNRNEVQTRKRSGPSPLVLLDVLLLLLILATTVYSVVVKHLSVLTPVTQAQQQFWQQRVKDLCRDNQRPVEPTLAPNADPLKQLIFLYDLVPYGERVWKLYQRCQVPRNEELGEDLLHFVENQYDKFEAKPDKEVAFEEIRRYVDKYLATGRTQIYVLGHTDERGSVAHNNQLSYNRALYIAEKIRQHLTAARKQEGHDYTLYPVGMGKSQLRKKAPGMTDEDWWKSCRRIELSFQGRPAAELTPQKELDGGGQLQRSADDHPPTNLTRRKV